MNILGKPQSERDSTAIYCVQKSLEHFTGSQKEDEPPWRKRWQARGVCLQRLCGAAVSFFTVMEIEEGGEGSDKTEGRLPQREYPR